MSLIWAIPPVALAAGAVLVLLQLRAMVGAAEDLTGQLHRLAEVRVAVDEVRAESAAVRTAQRGRCGWT